MPEGTLSKSGILPIRVAIVGTGNIGSREAKELSLRDDAVLAAGCDCDATVLREFADKWGCESYRDARTMFATESVDLAIICTTNASHAENVKAAAEAGVPNILCEKPLATTLEDAMDMVAITEAKNVRTSMGFGWGTKGAGRFILEEVRSGRLGEILNLYVHGYRGYGFWDHEFRTLPNGAKRHHPAVLHPKATGGWMVHHACHYVFWLSLLAGPASGVFARFARSASDAPGEEAVSGMISFRNGAAGYFSDSLGAFRGHECGIVGSKGTLVMRDPHRRDPADPIDIRIRYEGETEDHVTVLHHGENDTTRLAEMIRAIQEDAPSPIPLRVGLENMQICLAAIESNTVGQSIKINSTLQSA